MGKFKLQMKGNKALIRGLNKMNREAKEMVGYEIDESTRNIEADATSRVPVGASSFLKQSIRAQGDVRNLVGEVEVGMHYAAFVEFGTGTKVRVPQGLEQYAAQFKNTGKKDWKLFEASIRDWVKKKGLDEDAVWPIMMKILRVGIEPQPFLFPAFARETPKLIERINRGLEKLTK